MGIKKTSIEWKLLDEWMNEWMNEMNEWMKRLLLSLVGILL